LQPSRVFITAIVDRDRIVTRRFRRGSFVGFPSWKIITIIIIVLRNVEVIKLSLCTSYTRYYYVLVNIWCLVYTSVVIHHFVVLYYVWFIKEMIRVLSCCCVFFLFFAVSIILCRQLCSAVYSKRRSRVVWQNTIPSPFRLHPVPNECEDIFRRILCFFFSFSFSFVWWNNINSLTNYVVCPLIVIIDGWCDDNFTLRLGRSYFYAEILSPSDFQRFVRALYRYKSVNSRHNIDAITET